MSGSLGADHTVNFHETDPVAEIMRLTDGRGVDVAIEAFGNPIDFRIRTAGSPPGRTL